MGNPNNKIQRKDSDRIELLFVGRLEKEKGLEFLLKAVGLLQKDHNICLRIVGSGRMLKSSIALVKKMKIIKDCIFEGCIPRNELGSIYNNADIFVQPSLADANPVTILEAQSFGLPVVASFVGGIPEIVTHGENGLLVPPGDYRLLSKVLSRLINDRELRCRLGGRGEKQSVKFSWESVLNQFYDQLYAKKILKPLH